MSVLSVVGCRVEAVLQWGRCHGYAVGGAVVHSPLNLLLSAPLPVGLVENSKAESFIVEHICTQLVLIFKERLE